MKNQPKNLAISMTDKCKNCTKFEPNILSADVTVYEFFLITCKHRETCDHNAALDERMVANAY